MKGKFDYILNKHNLELRQSAKGGVFSWYVVDDMNSVLGRNADPALAVSQAVLQCATMGANKCQTTT